MRHRQYLVRVLGAEGEQAAGNWQLTARLPAAARMEQQLAAAIATRLRRIRRRVAPQDHRHPPRLRHIAQQRGVAVLVGDEEIASFVAQELSRLAVTPRDIEEILQLRP